jgi:hypothetical protein
LNYILLPDEIAKATIPNGAKILYGYILRLHKVRNGCYAHNSYFSDTVGVHDRQIQRYLIKLKENGYIWIYYKRDEKRRITSRQLVPRVKIDRGTTNDKSV